MDRLGRQLVPNIYGSSKHKGLTYTAEMTRLGGIHQC
jgi:hypothetical protein